MTAEERRRLAEADELSSRGWRLLQSGKPREALPLYRKVMDVRKEVLGEQHRDHATSMQDLAYLYCHLGDEKAAVPLYRKAIALYRRALGEMHPDYATSLNALGVLYQDMGDHKQALLLCQQALKLRKEVLGKGVAEYAESLYALAGLQQALKQPEKAVASSEEALTLIRGRLSLFGAVQSERQQLAAAESARYYLDLRLSLAEDARDAVRCCDHVLAWKGAVFAAGRQRRLFARLQQGNPEVRRLATELEATTRTLATLALAPIDADKAIRRREQMEKLTLRKEGLESDLSRLAADFRASRTQEQLTAEQLRGTLPAGVALVDFLFYTRSDYTQKEKSRRKQRRLTAFVLSPGSSRGAA